MRKQTLRRLRLSGKVHTRVFTARISINLRTQRVRSKIAENNGESDSLCLKGARKGMTQRMPRRAATPRLDGKMATLPTAECRFKATECLKLLPIPCDLTSCHACRLCRLGNGRNRHALRDWNHEWTPINTNSLNVAPEIIRVHSWFV